MSSLPLLIEPEQLNDKLQDANLLIVDVSSDENYLRAHVPGAIHIPASALTSGQPPIPGGLPNTEQLSQLFSGLGLIPDSHVIAYDDEGGGWAGRLIWTLDVIGHQQYSYLNGGIHAWLEAGMTAETQPNAATITQVSVGQIVEQPIARKEYILNRLGADNLAIWDTRSPGEYTGEKLNAARGGHIPGAENYEWTLAMDPSRQLRLRDLDEIRTELANLGITADKEVITYCQTHHRSGLTYLLGKLLNFPNIKAYPGSWADWGNDPDTPIEQ